MGDLKEIIDVWNALKHVPPADALGLLVIFGAIRMRKSLLSQPWQFHLTVQADRLSLRFSHKTDEKGRSARRAKRRSRPRPLTALRKAGRIPHSPSPRAISPPDR